MSSWRYGLVKGKDGLLLCEVYFDEWEQVVAHCAVTRLPKSSAAMLGIDLMSQISLKKSLEIDTKASKRWADRAQRGIKKAMK